MPRRGLPLFEGRYLEQEIQRLRDETDALTASRPSNYWGTGYNSPEGEAYRERENRLADQKDALEARIRRELGPTQAARLTRSAEARASAEDPSTFKEKLTISSKSFTPHAYHANRAPYLCSVLSATEDYYGRHYLMDARFYNTSTTLLLSGNDQTVLAAIDNEHHTTWTGDGQFPRQHGLPGARILGAGIGAIAYMASALGNNYFNDYKGVCSPVGGRSAEAEAMWGRLHRKRITERAEADGDGDQHDIEVDEYCLRFPRDHDKYIDSGGPNDETVFITSDEVCGPVMGVYETRPEYDILYAEALTKSPFIVFANSNSNTQYDKPTSDKSRGYARWNNFSSSWERDGGQFKTTVLEDDDVTADTSGDGLLEEYFDSNGQAFVRPETCELLLRAYHGAKPALAFMIVDLLARCGTEEQAVTYLSRADVGEELRNNPRILELMGQRRLPGIAGLSLHAHREVMQAVRLGSLAQAIRSNPSNPLNFPAYSAKLQQELAKYDLP